MNRPLEVLWGAVLGIRQQFATVAGQSERTLLLGIVVLGSAVSLVTGFVLAQYFEVDALASLVVFAPDDCYLNFGTNVGRHCFSDYAIPMSVGTRANPWDPYPLYLPPDFKPAANNYTAAAMVPQTIFGLLGKWLGSPELGLLGYQTLLTIAVFSPAVWAARGARGLEQLVVFVACGIAAIPVWVVMDRANAVGFVMPIALVFLVALSRQRWGLAAVLVILAALVKPQFAVLGVALFAARRWRWGGIAVAGTVISNLAAYALWPRDFPGTIAQSIRGVLGYGGGTFFQALVADSNVSFGKAIFSIPDGIKSRATGGIPDGFLSGPRSLIGYAILALVVACVVALGRRIPPVMVGIVLLATACLFPTLSNPYYLVFVLPVAALMVRDPDGPVGTGIFDRFAATGGRRRAVGVCMSLAVALCIAQVALPGPPLLSQVAGPIGVETRAVVVTTVVFAPVLWLVTCAVIIISYARRPAPADDVAGAPAAPEAIAEFSPQSLRRPA